jgi:hypothetical protein
VCISGGTAEVLYGRVPEFIIKKVMAIPDKDLRETTRTFVEVCTQRFSLAEVPYFLLRSSEEITEGFE